MGDSVANLKQLVCTGFTKTVTINGIVCLHLEIISIDKLFDVTHLIAVLKLIKYYGITKELILKNVQLFFVSQVNYRILILFSLTRESMVRVRRGRNRAPLNKLNQL